MPTDLVATLGAPTKSERRRAATALISDISKPGVLDAVRAAIADPLAERRWGATFVLHRTGARDDSVFRGALDALASGDGDVRWAAAEIVVDLAGAAASRVEALRELVHGSAAEARKMALYCLRDLGVAGAKTCTGALSDPDRGVRLAAVAGLARMDTVPRESVAAIERAMREDGDAGVRRAAAVALGRHAAAGSPARAALEALRASTTDADLVRAIDRALAAPSGR